MTLTDLLKWHQEQLANAAADLADPHATDDELANAEYREEIHMQAVELLIALPTR